MAITKVVPAVIAVTNNITSNTFGSANTIPSFQVDGSGVIVAASNTAITLTANSVANNQFQTGSVENYMLAQGSSFGIRNKIINGAMMIDQRNGGAAISNDTSGTQYSLDRWLIYGTQSAKFTVQQDSSANTVAGFASSLKVTSSSAYTLNGTDTFHITQRVEGLNTYDLAWGTVSAKSVTLSFWVRSSLTGTFGGVIKNNATDYNYPFSYTIVAANTWEQKFITITGATSGTWLSTNGTGLNLRFGLGSNYTAGAGSWAGGYADSATGATSVVGTNAATWYITGVQLEKGSQATPFEYRPYGKEFMLCQRYYQKWVYTLNSNMAVLGLCTSTSSVVANFPFYFPMRDAPTVTIPTSGSGSGQWGFLTSGGTYPGTIGTITADKIETFSFRLQNSGSTSAFTQGNACWLYTNTGSPTVTANAEL